jgi:hypothetical protein
VPRLVDYHEIEADDVDAALELRRRLHLRDERQQREDRRRCSHERNQF